ncbi:Biotin holocarboxylase synthetase/biotin-protein ligase [Phaffia rhodozyma]|uniref:Biotin holocarboxylase synthetase/biotin-protein ligase n=1 Tax=Phaffia rhodozyma TaxID=264483 RepID=A0A0F7SIS6_PHARH|nr:Biotin holocarboxylase synthetase/biotin-protein ligase [Phaffia rhodozyma]
MPRRFAVLIYSGPGVSATCLAQTTHCFSRMLSQHYTVSHLTPHSLLADPWPASCALLVLPGGRDLPYVEHIGAYGNARIRDYVQSGGSYLGICAGGYYASAHVAFAPGDAELEVVGDRELAFWPGTCHGPVFPGFQYGTELGAHLANVGDSDVDPALQATCLYYNGGGHFISPLPDGAMPPGATVLAKFVDHPDKPNAGILIKHGQGTVILLGFHPEYTLLTEPLKKILASMPNGLKDEEHILAAEEARLDLVRGYLALLGVHPPPPLLPRPITSTDGASASDDPAVEFDLEHPTKPLPQVLMTHPKSSAIVQSIIEALSPQFQQPEDDLPETSSHPTSVASTLDYQPLVLVDANDTLHHYQSSNHPSIKDLIHSVRSTPLTPEQAANMDDLLVKHVVLCDSPDDHTKVINERWTPLWNWPAFWKELDRKRQPRRSGVDPKTWRLGDAMMYAEAVTSTQTMLDKNPKLLLALPTPIISFASYQLSGRGRGGNVWLSPTGCLQFSTVVSLPSAQAQKVVFVQYLMALAICKALDPAPNCARDEGKLRIRIKWPNDVYVITEKDGKEERLKLGGVLVHSNWCGGQFKLIIGCGINILNERPTTSLVSLVKDYNSKIPADSSEEPMPLPTMESCLARIVAQFETMWDIFLQSDRGGFAEFIKDYEDRWLHSDQLVHLQSTNPPTAVRIETITLDYGLLRTRPVRKVDYGGEYDAFDRLSLAKKKKAPEPEFIDLQPDGNSFDMLANMIRTK